MDNRRVVAWRVAFRLACLAVVLGLAACGGGGEEGGDQATPGAGTGTPSVGTSTPSSATAAPSGKTVEISLWHSETASNLDSLQRLARRFNDSQSEVKVKLSFQGTSDDNMTKVLASLQGGDLPTIAYLDEVQAQRLVDSGGFKPVQDFIDREKYDLSDFDPKTIQYYTLDGKLWAMPISISVPVLLYNKLTFREVGLDPEKPPKDLEEFKEVSRKFVKRDSHGNLMRTGIALEIHPWYLEVALAEHGDLYLNNANGHEGRATAVEFDGPTGQAFFQWWHDMVKEGLALDVGLAQVSPDAILAVGAGQVVMTRSSTSVLRSVVDALEGGLAQTEVEPGLAASPGIPGGTGYTAVYTRGLWIPEDLPEAEQEAGWKFIKWLMEPEQQAEWFAGSGYLPVRNSSYDLPAAQEIMAKYPQFRTGVEIFRSSPATPATLGPVLGPFNEVRQAVLTQLQETIVGDKDPMQAISDAAEEASQIIEDYNRRIQ
jgi:sn-glycerol 3-phosphate transport system substrate-binding protein